MPAILGSLKSFAARHLPRLRNAIDRLKLDIFFPRLSRFQSATFQLAPRRADITVTHEERTPHDSRCLPAVLRLQVHGLRRRLPGGMLLRRRADALHPSG